MSPSAPSAASPRRRSTVHHGNLRQAAVDTAWAIISEDGPDALSLREVAKREGVAHRALYRHFADRDDLALAVAAEGFRRLAVKLQAALRRRGADENARATLMGAYVAFAVANPGPYRAMFRIRARQLMTHPLSSAAVREVIAVATEAYGSVPTERGDKRAIRDRVVAAWGLAHGLIDLWFSGALRARTAKELQTYIERLIREHLD